MPNHLMFTQIVRLACGATMQLGRPRKPIDVTAIVQRDERRGGWDFPYQRLNCVARQC